MSDSKQMLRRWIDAFVGKDLAAISECYDANAVNFQVATNVPAVGREQIERDTAESFRGFPD